MNIYGIFKIIQKSSKILIKQWQHVECGLKIKLKKPRYTTPTTKNQPKMTSVTLISWWRRFPSIKNLKYFVRKFNCPVWIMFNKIFNFVTFQETFSENMKILQIQIDAYRFPQRKLNNSSSCLHCFSSFYIFYLQSTYPVYRIRCKHLQQNTISCLHVIPAEIFCASIQVMYMGAFSIG